MARSNQTDPIRNFKFQVEIFPGSSGSANSALSTQVGASIGKLGFAVVSGISVSNEVIMYREGGMNTHPHKMIGQSDYAPVTFSKGIFAQEDNLWKWQTFLHNWNQGGTNSQGSTDVDSDYRCDVVVSVFDHPVSSGPYATPGQTDTAPTPAGKAKLRYKLYNCWPSSYSLTDLNAGDSSIMIQQMVLHHEGFQILWSPDAAGSAPLFAD